jgi:hypothetical protein
VSDIDHHLVQDGHKDDLRGHAVHDLTATVTVEIMAEVELVAAPNGTGNDVADHKQKNDKSGDYFSLLKAESEFFIFLNDN